MQVPHVLNRKNRILLKELTKTDFKLRYQGSVLGYLWALLRPLMMFAVLYVVFGHFLRFGGSIPHFPVYLLLGTVLWSFFTECTSQGIQAMISRGDLIRKVSFPKYIVVVSATMTALINLAINLCVVIIFVLISGITPDWSWFLIIPIILELYIFALGIAFLFGAINVKYRDVMSIWDVVISAVFYAIPVIYPISMVLSVSDIAGKILMLNPVAQVIQDARYIMITDETITTWSLVGDGTFIIKFIPIIIVLITLVAGSLYFRKKSRRFAEEV